MKSDKVISEFLERLGAERPFTGGVEESRTLTPDEIRELRDRLGAVARKNSVLAWFLVVGVFALAVAAFIVTAAVGGTLGLVSGGFTTMFILPVGRFLRSMWQENYRLGALWEIFPILTPSQQNEALTRFLYRDTSELATASETFAPAAQAMP